MKFKNLQEADLSLKLFEPKNWDKDIKCISDVKLLLEDSIVFVSNNNYFSRIIKNDKDILKSVGVIFDKKLYDSMDKDIIKSLSKLSGFIATTGNIEFSMSLISKLFYDEMLDRFNDEVDGRQMGTANIHPTVQCSQNVFIGKDVTIEENVKIYPNVVILSKSFIGKDSIIYPNATIYHNVIIGKNVRVHSNSVIGSDGFRYSLINNEHLKIWHLGGVVIGNDVEIGTNTSIDGGTFSPTIIGNGTKIDNLVQIAHNCVIGDNVIICGNTGMAGSVNVGDFTVFGGKAAITNGVKIGSYSIISGAAVVTSNIADKASVAGHPARNINEWLRGIAYLRKKSL